MFAGVPKKKTFLKLGFVKFFTNNLVSTKNVFHEFLNGTVLNLA